MTRLLVDCKKVQVKTAQDNYKTILEGVNFSVDEADVLYLLGPNGAGKSALLHSIAGSPLHKIEGEILFNYHPDFIFACANQDKEFQETIEQAKNQLLDISSLPPYHRSWLGIYLSFQEPLPIAGVKTIDLLFNIYRLRWGDTDEAVFEKHVKELCSEVGLQFDSLFKEVNLDYSGGEKKRLEVLTLLLVSPLLLMLDELDSGLDIDSERQLFGLIKEYAQEKGAAIIIVSHNFRVVNILEPTKAIVLYGGKLAKTGGKELVSRIVQKGYRGI